MRPIKYRVWDKEDKIMLESPQSVANLISKAITGVLKTTGQGNRYVFLQYTGIKDDDKTEIYENDIIRYTDIDHNEQEGLGVVVYFGDDEYPAFDVEPGLMSDSNGLSYIKACCKVSVVGDIYRNPGLLQG